MAEYKIALTLDLPFCQWIRKHYTKTVDLYCAECKHCMQFVFLESVYYHLILVHPDKLTKEEKQKIKFIHWIWDYFSPKDDNFATCNACKGTYKYIADENFVRIKKHLKRDHGISCPTLETSYYNMTDVSSCASMNTFTRRDQVQLAASFNYVLTPSTSRSTDHITDMIFPYRDVTEQPLLNFDAFSSKSHELYLSALNALKSTDHVNYLLYRSVTEQQLLLNFSDITPSRSRELYLSALSTLKSMDRNMDYSPHRCVTEQ